MQTMKPVVTRLYAVLVALTFVGLFVWAGADWYQLQERAQESGRAALRQAAGWIAELTIRHQPLDAENLERVFAPAETGRWKMLLLASDRGTEFYRGPRPPAPIDKVVPHWEAKPFSEFKVSLPVFLATGDPMVLEGISEFYGASEVFSLLKACGFTLLALLVLTTMMVILSSRSPEDDEKDDENAAAPISPRAPVSGEELSVDEDEYWFDDNLTLEDIPPLDDIPPLAPSVPEPARASPSLFSPRTGLGWESFLPSRLGSELERSSSQNQDLALILLTVKDGSVPPAAWGDAVRQAFSVLDLNFEHEGGAAVIVPGHSLEQALKAARAFVDSAESHLQAVVHAGVAARSGRLLSAATLLAEAGSALRRSLAGSVRVLGLKTDAERYRQHLASASA